jgi:hypothetical protein
MNRAALIKMLHVGPRRLGWDDDTYRAWLEKHTGKRSAKDCNDSELSLLADALRDLGALEQQPAAPRTAPGRVGADRPTQQQWRAALAIAKKLGMSGMVTDPAFITFCKKTAQVENPRFLDRSGMSVLITGLDNWLKYRQSHPASQEA